MDRDDARRARRPRRSLGPLRLRPRRDLAGGEEIVARGELEGSFAEEPRGSEGFGYDPIFVPSGESRTVAELGNAWKDEHSHRARAAHALAERLAR